MTQEREGRIDLPKVTAQIDDYFMKKEGAKAEALMRDTLARAVETQDDNAQLTMLNELIGYYRETSQVERSYQLADQALLMLDRMGLQGTIPYATTLLNIANAYRAGGRLSDSLSCYEKTMEIYQKGLEPDDMLMASLYNNISLLYQESGAYQKAKESLQSALAIVGRDEKNYFEIAVTYANLAATCLELDEDKEAQEYFQKAISIFEQHGIRDAHYSAALSALASFYMKQERYVQAAEHLKNAMSCMKESLGENEYYQRMKEKLSVCERAMEQKTMSEAEEGKKPERKGLALCRDYYETLVRPMLLERFPEYAGKIAAGLVGEGSDCFGYDDAVSRDHDWGPDICLWVSRETYEKIGPALQEAYEALPQDFEGFARTGSEHGRGRRGVQTIDQFYTRLLGERDWEQWGREKVQQESTDCFAQRALPQKALLTEYGSVSDASLAASVNGEVFMDEEGIFSAVRERLSEGYPESVRYLKLAESGAVFSQCGQYNYRRMLDRGDVLTAYLMLSDALKAAMKLCYYLENQYPPHDKWLFEGLKRLPGTQELRALLCELAGEQGLLKGESSRREKRIHSEGEAVSDSTEKLLERLADILVKKLYDADAVSDMDSYLDAHTGELLYKAQLAGKTDLQLVEEIARLEFEAFDKVRNVGGRADCQNDWYTFSIMRRSQYLTWDRTMLLQYLYDFQRELSKGHNLITEKYGRMMESTAPREYEEIKMHFPQLSQEKKDIIEAIVKLQVGWMEEFEARYPTLAGNARSVHTAQDSLYNTSYETYLRGEISTYSDKMLQLYGRYVVSYARQEKNLTYDIMSNSVLMYGYQGLDEAEEQMSRLRL